MLADVIGLSQLGSQQSGTTLNDKPPPSSSSAVQNGPTSEPPQSKEWPSDDGKEHQGDQNKPPDADDEYDANKEPDLHIPNKSTKGEELGTTKGPPAYPLQAPRSQWRDHQVWKASEGDTVSKGKP
jgi:hypothetical protein